jgi:hypothetical protein
MSMCSLTDFVEVSPWSVRMSASTATVTGQGTSQVDTSVRGGDFSWPQAGTFHGHHRGPQMAISEDFFMATDSEIVLSPDAAGGSEERWLPVGGREDCSDLYANS